MRPRENGVGDEENAEDEGGTESFDEEFDEFLRRGNEEDRYRRQGTSLPVKTGTLAGGEIREIDGEIGWRLWLTCKSQL